MSYYIYRGEGGGGGGGGGEEVHATLGKHILPVTQNNSEDKLLYYLDGTQRCHVAYTCTYASGVGLDRTGRRQDLGVDITAGR